MLLKYTMKLRVSDLYHYYGKGGVKVRRGAVEKRDTWVINICSSTFPPARLDSRILVLEWDGRSWLLSDSSPSLCHWFPATGGVSQVAGLGFPGSLEEMLWVGHWL